MTTVVVARMLAGLAVFLGALGLVLLVCAAFPAGRARLRREFASPRSLLALAWCVALAATAGSLYFSNVAGFTPCVLCWWQRIAMYPLVLVLGVGALTADPRAWRYAAPLVVAGLAIAVYHIGLQFRPALDVGACEADVPCTLRYVSAFGFVTIPGMSAASFAALGGLLGAAAVAHRPGGEGTTGADDPGAGGPGAG